MTGQQGSTAKAGHHLLSGGFEVPFDFSALTDMKDWRQNFAWPSDPRSSREIGIRQFENLFKIMANLDPMLRAVISAAAGPIGGFALIVVESALVVQNAAKHDLAICGGPDETAYLRGDLDDLPAVLMRRPNQWIPPVAARLRQIKINWSISRWNGLKAMMRTDTALISRNSLQNRQLSLSQGKVAFRHPESILYEAVKAYGQPRHDEQLDAVGIQLAEALVEGNGLEEPVLSRCSIMIAQLVRQNLAAAHHDIASCVAYTNLPKRIWSGTAGYYPARVIGLASIITGGEAIRFDHGGPSLLASTNKFGHAVVEDIAATTCILPSQKLADVARSHYQILGSKISHPVAFKSGGGDPAYLTPPTRHTTAARRRVLYPPTLLSGFWQYSNPDLPDIVNLDWQIRLAEQLAALPIKLVCKPHPEGILRNIRSPLEDIAPVSYSPFESHIAETDLFVLDLMGSTTFWKAMCTDRPVVYLDLGMVHINELFAPAIDRRCRIVRAHYNERNLPYVDRDELADAILTAPNTADPTEILKIVGASEYLSTQHS